jgi:hypothetical protein
VREFTDDPIRSPAVASPSIIPPETESDVATLVVLLQDRGSEASVSSEAATRLAALGVTRVAVVRNDEMLGFVLEGWAFNPDRSAQAALDALAPNAPSARTLRMVMETALHAAVERS